LRTLIVPDLLIDGTGSEPSRGVGVLVENERIIAVDRIGNLTADDVALQHMPGTTLLPGLIDSHLHLELSPTPDHESGIRQYHADKAAGRLTLRALHHAQLALSAGVTTVRDAGSSFEILAVRDLIASGVVGPRLLVSGPPLTTTAGHFYWMRGGRADTAEAVRIRTRAHIERGVDSVKVMSSGGQMTHGSNPRAPQYTVEELAVFVAEAHRLGRRTIAHALSEEAVRRCVVAGVDSIDHCLWLRPDGDPRYDPSLGRSLAEAKVSVGMTGASLMRRKATGELGEEGLEELRVELAENRAMFEDGVVMNVVSDAGARYTEFDRFDLSIRVMVEGLGVSVHQALVAATKTAAWAVGLHDQIGTIEPGKLADLVVLDGNPLDDLAHLRRVRQVIKEGKVVVDQGRMAGTGRLSLPYQWW
jgi:imidazolonepropionase-like amidohydrolase